jgi:hypothetical protein
VILVPIFGVGASNRWVKIREKGAGYMNQALKLFDQVLLNTGEIAYITKIYKPGTAYEANIRTIGGPIVDTILQKNIVKVYPVRKEVHSQM